jgi:diguanylate cyclase (GGDEF)-like protein
MMHDALRADVISAVPVSDADRLAALTATARDADQLRAGLSATPEQLAALRDPKLVATYQRTRSDLSSYAAFAERIAALAASDPAAAARDMPEFNRRFEAARQLMADLTALLRTAAGKADAATSRTESSTRLHMAWIGGVALLLLLALTGTIWRSVRASLAEKATAEAGMRDANERLRAEATREGFDSTLKDAFDMATTENEAQSVVRRAVLEVVPGRRAELLLADNSKAHLTRVMTEPGDDAPGCGVLTPTDCIAVRRGRPVRFGDAEGVGACPKLVGRGNDIGQACCSPVTFLGEGLGVLHVVTKPGEELSDESVRSLAVTAELAGTRVGTLRAFQRSQLQASTDGLTGLLNRRTVEEKIGELQRSGRRMSLALCDLDHFKTINDTFGHEAGDRALRVFSATLRSVMRSEDLIARYGGEEFLLAMPDCDLRAAEEVLGRIRSELSLTLDAGGAPAFTASFGLTVVPQDQPLDEVVRAADAALLRAKAEGRDRIVIAAAPVKA